MIASPRRWSELASRMLAGDRMHQRTSLTYPDRYPLLFAALRELLDGRPAPRLLSHGCSSGEEVVALRRYFPDAALTGTEINRQLLWLCRRRSTDPNARFAAPDDPAVAARGPYDAIFCMAVLTRRPHEIERRGVRDISRIYPFGLFEREVRHLAGLLAPGGFLVIEHPLYRVEDAVAGLGLTSLASHGHALAKGPRFAPDGTLIVPPPIVARIFRKGDEAGRSLAEPAPGVAGRC